MSDETPRDPYTPGTERVERVEYIERVPGGSEPPRNSSPMWVWVLPLVLIALALIWYVLSRGEPTSPVEIITLVGSAGGAILLPG